MNWADVEALATGMRRCVLAGAMTPQEYHATLAELVVFDDAGFPWLLGAQTGAWYRRDVSGWVPDAPPASTGAPAPPPPSPASNPPEPRRSQAAAVAAGALMGLVAVVFAVALIRGGEPVEAAAPATGSTSVTMTAPVPSDAAASTAAAERAAAPEPEPPAAVAAARPMSGSSTRVTFVLPDPDGRIGALLVMSLPARWTLRR